MKTTARLPTANRRLSVAPLHREQGDQIGRIFAQRAVVSFGQSLFESYRSSTHFNATFFLCIENVYISTKPGFGYILNFFRKLIWDGCFDYLNIFAEKFSKTLAFLTPNKA
jgi:hypothetical protein